MDIEKVIGDYQTFYRKLAEKIKALGIETSQFKVDHFCFRTATLRDYHQMKDELLKYSQKFLENFHHGRPFTKFILNNPLQIDGQQVDIIELPSPKPNTQYQNGLEHFEFVVGKEFKKFVKKYHDLWGGHDDSGEYNQPVFIKFEEGVVKFHELSLREVVKKEGNVFKKII